MARYTWGYDDQVFDTLAQVKTAVRELVEQFLADNYLELIEKGERAEYEVTVDVRLRPH